MGNNMSTPSEGSSPTPRNSIRSAIGSIRPRTNITAPKSTRTTPRSIDVLEAASSATLALRPAETGHTGPKTLATTLRNRNIDRTAFTFFSCGRNVFIHFAGMALAERNLVKAKPGTVAFEKAAEEVWIEVTMNDTKQRAVWEDAAKEAKAALTNDKVAAAELLEAHCVPARKEEYAACAMGAVDELVERYALGTWPQRDETWFAQQAATSAPSEIDESETRERTVEAAVERELVSAINLRDLSSQHFVGVEPSIRGFDQSSARSVTPTTPTANESAYPFPTSGPVEVVDAAATARLYLDLNMTPPRSNRESVYSIAASLSTEVDTEAVIGTAERVTPSKAKIVDC